MLSQGLAYYDIEYLSGCNIDYIETNILYGNYIGFKLLRKRMRAYSARFSGSSFELHARIFVRRFTITWNIAKVSSAVKRLSLID